MSRDERDEKPWLKTLSDIGCERMFIASPLKEEVHYRYALQRAKRRWGQVDTVINLADMPCVGLFETSNDDDCHWTFEHNFMSVARGCKAAISLMKKQGHGRLVNITSQAARLPQPNLALSSSIQGAVVSLSESLQAELSRLDIRVQIACLDFFAGSSTEMRAQTPLDKARFGRMENHDLSGDEVAAKVFRGLDKNTFLILPHKQGRHLWRAYRLNYNRWLSAMRTLAKRIRPNQHLPKR